MKIYKIWRSCPKKPWEKYLLMISSITQKYKTKIIKNLKRTTIKGINSTLQQVEMADISKNSQSLRQFFLNARDAKQEPIFIGLKSSSYGRAFATYTVEKEPQAKNFINNLPTKLEIFDKISL